MERNAQPIGVFDSGVGGLTVVAKLRMLLPHENIIYVGDTKRNPYGTRTPEEILAYTRDILRFMTAQGVKLVAIGCNTVTAVAYDTVVREVPYPLIGMSRGLRTAREISATKKIAVFATPLTIANHSHRKVAAAMDPDIEIVEQSCPALANLIERPGNPRALEALYGTGPSFRRRYGHLRLHPFSLCPALVRRALR